MTLDEVERLRREIQDQFRLRDERWRSELDLRDRALTLAHQNGQSRIAWWLAGISVALGFLEIVLHFWAR